MRSPDSVQFCEPSPARIGDLKLPERADIASPDVRSADLRLLSKAPPGYLDTTHFDTVRFPPPHWALERFAAAAEKGALAYTGYRGNAAVLEAVAENLSRFLGRQIDPAHNLILTPGTQAALFAVLSSRVEAGERVAVISPDYLFTARILRFVGAEIGYIPLTLSADGGYLPDLDMLEAEFAERGARHLVFSHPNNPTGAVYPRATLRAIADLANRHNVGVVADELYCRLVYGDDSFPHLLSEDGMFDRTATLLGPSKTESLSGYRVGVIVGAGPLMTKVEDVLSITALRAPAYAQHVLGGWLDGDEAWLADRIADFAALRDMTATAFRELAWVRVAPQRGTAYLWPDVSALGLSGSVVAETLAEKAGVLVSPGYQFGPESSGFFRVCYARDEDVWSAALERVQHVLDELWTAGRTQQTTPTSQAGAL